MTSVWEREGSDSSRMKVVLVWPSKTGLRIEVGERVCSWSVKTKEITRLHKIHLKWETSLNSILKYMLMFNLLEWIKIGAVDDYASRPYSNGYVATMSNCVLLNNLLHFSKKIYKPLNNSWFLFPGVQKSCYGSNVHKNKNLHSRLI